jgi:hypothetical protein
MIASNWKDMPDGREKRQMYLCSREWGLKKKAVRERAGGKCERCSWQDIDAIHHLTYARYYDEELTDLMAVCDDCHKHQHGLSDYDPADFSAFTKPPVIPPDMDDERFANGLWNHLIENGVTVTAGQFHEIRRPDQNLVIVWSDDLAFDETQWAYGYYKRAARISDLATNYVEDRMSDYVRVEHVAYDPRTTEDGRLCPGPKNVKPELILLGYDRMTAEQFGANANSGRGADPNDD